MLENEHIGCFDTRSDEELVCLYNNGSQSAFQQLAVRYIFVIRNKSSDLYNQGVETDDLLQEGLLGLHNAVRSFRFDGDASFRTYAGVCIRNRLVSAVRSANAEKNKINNTTFSIDEAEGIPLPSDFEPENAVILKEELTALINDIKNKLSATELSVLLCYLEGMSYEHMAAKLNMTRKSCDNAMQRVRKKLKIRG